MARIEFSATKSGWKALPRQSAWLPFGNAVSHYYHNSQLPLQAFCGAFPFIFAALSGENGGHCESIALIDIRAVEHQNHRIDRWKFETNELEKETIGKSPHTCAMFDFCVRTYSYNDINICPFCSSRCVFCFVAVGRHRHRRYSVFKAYFRKCCCCRSIRPIFLFSSFQSSITQAITIFFGSNTKTWTIDRRSSGSSGVAAPIGPRYAIICMYTWHMVHTYSLPIPIENGSNVDSYEFCYPNNKVSCIFPMWPFDDHLSV